MDKEFKFIIKSLKDIKLKEEEKVSMRTHLLEQLFSKEEVNIKNSLVRSYLENIKNYFFVINGHKFVPAFVIIFLIAFSGGISSFAEKALPGDLLYGIKISINEPAVGMFTSSKVERIKWKEKLVERRLEEVQKLISNDDLEETTRIDLENEIKSKIDELSTEVNDLSLEEDKSISPDEITSSSDLNIKLQTSLDSYKEKIEKISGDTNISEDTKEETKKLLTTLGEYKEKVSSDYQDLQSNIKANTGTSTKEKDSVDESGGGEDSVDTIDSTSDKSPVDSTSTISDPNSEKTKAKDGNTTKEEDSTKVENNNDSDTQKDNKQIKL